MPDTPPPTPPSSPLPMRSPDRATDRVPKQLTGASSSPAHQIPAAVSRPASGLFQAASRPLAQHLASEGASAAQKPALDRNMEWAIKAISHTRLLVPNSANMRYTSSPITRSSGEILGQTTEHEHHELIDQIDLDRRKRKSTGIEFLKILQYRCSEFKEGTCPQLAGIAALYLKEKQRSSIDIVTIEDEGTDNSVLPHFLLVIGLTATDQRPDGPNLGLPDTWHEDAVICDPWDKVAYPAEDYEQFWNNLRQYQADKTRTLEVHHLRRV